MCEGRTIDSLQRQTRARNKPCPVASILQSSSLVQRPSPRRGWPLQYAPLQSSDGALTSLLFIYRPLYIYEHTIRSHTHTAHEYSSTQTHVATARALSAPNHMRMHATRALVHVTYDVITKVVNCNLYNTISLCIYTGVQ